MGVKVPGTWRLTSLIELLQVENVVNITSWEALIHSPLSRASCRLHQVTIICPFDAF